MAVVGAANRLLAAISKSEREGLVADLGRRAKTALA